MVVYDADGQIMGRLGSVIAKKLLDGESVVVVNVEKAVVSGDEKAKVSHYAQRVKRGDPIKGPFFPRIPHGIFRRAVRGMLPMKKTKGGEAYKRLKVYIGVPEEFKNKADEFKKEKVADSSKLKIRSITLGELSVRLGSKKRW